ncbi:hypothetical protein L1276_002479 [Flavobacterium sp. HSC-32F16]|uniref:hypothetical protein n=1 Tax=Flavobacterium sp. HSC-32F16 TaxID=2910964 RepID=UPI0020A5CB0C|nr:hypothetical protein [Flavobacterium sp. HSC-32F16]MCP2027322.1 hypothetical protein [Flavobacterium sp. HSC-32F16]
MKSVKKIVKATRVVNKDSKVTVDPSLKELKDIKFKSGKTDEINKLNFKLSFNS